MDTVERWSRSFTQVSVSSIHSGPTVVFVDDAQWECFFQLASILRKEGIRTVRVSVGLKGWQGNRLLFNRHVSLPVPPTPEQLSEILSNEYVTDVHPTESLAIVTYAALDLLPASQRSDSWLGRRALLDKWRIAGDLRALGLRTPDTLLVELVTPAEAEEILSLPMVVKRRVSSGGLGVEIFERLESLEEFVSRIEEPREWIYQRFVEGRPFVCAGCVGDDGFELIATYEILKRSYTRGPSIVVGIMRDLSIDESARLLFNTTQIRGLVCFDIIRDVNDVDWIHDVNPRTSSGISMCQSVGVDFYSFYIQGLLRTSHVELCNVDEIEAKAYVFPSGWKELFKSGRASGEGILGFQWARRYARLLGPRYFLNMATRGNWRIRRRALRFWRDVVPRTAQLD
ncbi:MAG: ATP-grasp domain-containing protein [Acidimicrobiales bacterium]